MRHITLKELPPPPPEKEGWPWTEESPQSPDTIPDSSSWPKISIVTPSLNQGQFIEETIRSILLQNYPNLEYIIIDGGSTDDTLSIIKNYEKWVNFWVSEQDRGQAHAINKGWNIAKGSLLGWINSDDILLPGSLWLLGETHKKNPYDLVAGDVINFELNNKEENKILIKQSGLTFRNFAGDWRAKFSWHQPGIYFPKNVLELAGPLDESLHYEFDYDLMIRVLQIAKVFYLNKPILKFRIHGGAKTQKNKNEMQKELKIISKRYAPLIPRAQAYWAVNDGLKSFKNKKIKEGLALFSLALKKHFRGAITDFCRTLFKK